MAQDCHRGVSLLYQVLSSRSQVSIDAANSWHLLGCPICQELNLHGADLQIEHFTLYSDLCHFMSQRNTFGSEESMTSVFQFIHQGEFQVSDTKGPSAMHLQIHARPK